MRPEVAVDRFTMDGRIALSTVIAKSQNVSSGRCPTARNFLPKHSIISNSCRYPICNAFLQTIYQIVALAGSPRSWRTKRPGLKSTSFAWGDVCSEAVIGLSSHLMPRRKTIIVVRPARIAR
jgi:hypothetical protein